MPQAKQPTDGAAGQPKQQDVRRYIFDLLGSLETIAAQNKLPVLARLIATAKSEARQGR